MRCRGLPLGESALKKRDVVSDPQTGDILVRDGQKIEVTLREGDTVHYIALAAKNCPIRPLYQSVTGWQRWAGGFKVKSRGLTPGECVVMGDCISGPCIGCGHYCFKNVHLTDEGIRCEVCCTASVHGKQKEKKGVPA